jgi:Flp pilus assembly pilin Flp
MRLSSMPKHSAAKPAEPAFASAAALQQTLNRWLRAFSGEVDTGSPSENATTQREKSEARFYQNGSRSSDESGAAAVEYSLLVAFISLVILAAIESVSGGISGVASKLTTTLAGM